MTTKKLVFECEKCGFDNHISIDLELDNKSIDFELDDLVLKHKNKRPYPNQRKYLDSRDEVNLTN